MNTKTRKTNNGNTKGEPKSFTPQEVERSVLKALAPALEAKGGSAHTFADWTLSGPWHRPRFVHGPGVLVDPGRGVLLTFRRAGGLGIPGPASEDCDDQAATVTPCSFLGLIMGIMLQHVQL